MQCSMDHALLLNLNARLESEKCLLIVDLGTCSLHPVHTVVRKAIEALSFDVEQFVSDICQWFRLSSACREYYEMVQKEDLEHCIGEFFLKPVFPVLRPVRVLTTYNGGMVEIMAA